MITVDSLSILNSLKHHEEGETAYVSKEQKVYQYSNGEWTQQGLPEGKMNLSVYDMNKQLISQLPDIDDIAILTNIRKYKNDDGKQFMLICRDINYYTLFALDKESEDRMEQEVLNCIKDIGTPKSIERIDGTDAMEIWAQPKDEEPLVMYFFNQDKGVITCK